jgi:hypothetical protein
MEWLFSEDVACYYRQQLTVSQLSLFHAPCMQSWCATEINPILQTVLPCWCPNGQAVSVTDLTCSHSPTPRMHLHWMRHLRPSPKLKNCSCRGISKANHPQYRIHMPCFFRDRCGTTAEVCYCSSETVHLANQEECAQQSCQNLAVEYQKLTVHHMVRFLQAGCLGNVI